VTKSPKHKKEDIPVIGIGMLGYGDMGRAHSNGYLQMPYIFWPPPAVPKLVKLCGRNEELVRKAAKRFGFSRYCMDWKDLVSDKDIDIFVNVGPNNIHAESCIAAAKNGKHIVCEKPLGRNKEEARQMLDAVKKANIKNICNFSNRFIPALALAKKLLSGNEFGDIYHFRVNYLMDYFNDPAIPISWRMIKDSAGSGTTADLAIHSIDLARWLCGDPSSVMAITKTFIKERPEFKGSNEKVKVDADDASIAILEFDNGSIGYLEATTFATGRRAFIGVELNAEKGSIYWNFEDMGHLHVYKKGKNKITRGFQKISVSQDYHPYYDKWLPFEEIPMGFSATFVHTAYHIVDAAINNTSLEPMVATFEDGYKASVICDAILKSAQTGRKEKIAY
jgi:predicted dehydrogenase